MKTLFFFFQSLPITQLEKLYVYVTETYTLSLKKLKTKTDQIFFFSFSPIANRTIKIPCNLKIEKVTTTWSVRDFWKAKNSNLCDRLRKKKKKIRLFSIFRWNSARKTKSSRCEFVSNDRTRLRLIENGEFSLQSREATLQNVRSPFLLRSLCLKFYFINDIYHISSLERRLNIFVIYDVFGKYLRSSSMLTARKWVYKSVCLLCCLTKKEKKEKILARFVCWANRIVIGIFLSSFFFFFIMEIFRNFLIHHHFPVFWTMNKQRVSSIRTVSRIGSLSNSKVCSSGEYIFHENLYKNFM